MPANSSNITAVTTANTFGEWRIQTNLASNDVNTIIRGDFVKPEGNLIVSQNIVVDSNVSVAGLINAQSGNITTLYVQTLTVGDGLPGFQGVSEAANSVRVSANSGSILAPANGINFINTATVQVSVGSGIDGNANVGFIVVGGGGGGGGGAQGAQGVQGAQGTRAGVPYSWNSGTTDGDPGNGLVRYNSGTISSVSQIYIDLLDSLGVNQSAWYDTWDDSTDATKGYLTLISAGSGTIVNIFRVTGAVISASGYYKIPVAYVSGSLPTNGTALVAEFSRTGNVGAQGAQGTSGIQSVSPALTGTPTAPTAPAGTQSTQIATTAFACPGFSHGANGYDKLPSGLVLQWGSTYVGDTGAVQSGTINFPISFPSAVYTVVATYEDANGGSSLILATVSKNTSSFTWIVGETANFTQSGTIMWFAIGK